MPVAKQYRDSPYYAGTQTDEAFAKEAAHRDAPWSATDLLKVKAKALALVRSHVAIDLPGKQTRATFDGHALWELMGALDRAPIND